jgi:hypothetical protein
MGRRLSERILMLFVKKYWHLSGVVLWYDCRRFIRSRRRNHAFLCCGPYRDSRGRFAQVLGEERVTFALIGE